MSNYNEQEVAGTSYTRAFSVVVHNGLEKKSIQFEEEKVIVLGDDQISRELCGMVFEAFNAENAGTEIELRDPATGELLSSTMTYQDIYVGLYSLYLQLALARDAQIEEIEEIEEAEDPDTEQALTTEESEPTQ